MNISKVFINFPCIPEKHYKSMTHQALIYAYIESKNILEHSEFSFHHNYDIHYDYEARVMRVNQLKSLPNQFWGDKVVSLSCIVGNNGAGKTTMLRFLLDNITAGQSHNKEDHYILVYLNIDNGAVSYFSSVGDISVEGNVVVSPIDNAKDKLDESHPWPIYNILYSSYSQLPISGMVFTGSKLLSEGWIMHEDLETGTNMDHNTLSIIPYNQAVSIQNNREQYRVSRFINEAYGLIKSLDITTPSVFRFSIDDTGSLFYAQSPRPSNRTKKTIEELTKRLAQIKVDNKRTRFLLDYVFSVLLNISREDLDAIDYWIPILKSYVAYIKRVKVLDQERIFKSIMKSVARAKERYGYDEFTKHPFCRGEQLLSHANRVLDTLVANSEHVELYARPNDSCYYIRSDSNKASLIFQALFPKDQRLVLLTGEYLKVSYGYNQYMDCELSSGEKQVYKLFSRLYNTLVLEPKALGKTFSGTNVVLALDEAEVGLHPDWQRKFIAILLNFLDKIPNPPIYQILLTTHSPLILSDIPRCCVTYLQRVGDKSHTVARSTQKESFGANVYDILSSPFFMDKYVGDYASQVIGKYITKVEACFECTEKECETLYHELEIIGDDFIRLRLQERVLKNCHSKSIRHSHAESLRKVADKYDKNE